MTTETVAPVALPKRHEVPLELTWNLDVIYAADSAWESDYTRIEKLCAEFAQLAGTLGQSPQQLLHVLQQRDEIGIALSQLYSYASLRRSENNANADAQAKADRANMLYTKYGSATAWVEPEILAMPSSQVRDFLAEESGLQTYSYYLETLERRRPHVRSSEVEDVLAQAGEAMYATGTVFKLFNNADLKFPQVRDEEGREVELSHGRYLSFLESRNRK
jgi:oligoendopeptidase F